MNEEQAITLCLQHRDPIGFEYLVNRYRREAYFHALAFMKNREEAADACQESFSRAYSSMPGLQRLDRFYPWFYTILKHCCLNMLRKNRTAERHAEESRDFGFDDVFRTSPDQNLETSQEKERVHRCLSHLKFEFREILMLKYAEDMDYQGIAELLNIPRGTVMSRLYHARKAFHQEYTKRRTP